MRYSIPVDWEAMQDAVAAVLNEDLRSFEESLKRVNDTNRGYMFEIDPKDDAKEIKRHIKALKRVLEYYGG